MTILIFDLDDTLYPEVNYAESGFEAVSDFVLTAYQIPREITLRILLSALHSGERDTAFQKLSLICKLPNRAIRECLAVYRGHKPKINLDDSTKQVLNTYAQVNKYVVTDGNKIVQKRKVDALKLESIFNRCLITHNFGLKAAKPSIICFDKIRKIESATWKDLVYVGDDPKKDFVNLKPLGVKTVRVMTGKYSKIEASSKFEAEIRIPSLMCLDDALQSRYEKEFNSSG
jgi:putative hydrolase of the HAD superfamily